MEKVKCLCGNVNSMKQSEYLPLHLDEALNLPSILTVSNRKPITIIDGLKHDKLMRLVSHYEEHELSESVAFSLMFRSGCTLFYHKYNDILENLCEIEYDMFCSEVPIPDVSTSLSIRFNFGTKRYKVIISDADRKNIKWWSKILECTMMDLGSYLILKAISSATTKTTPQYLIDECIEKVTAFEHGIDAVIKIRTEILKIVV